MPLNYDFFDISKNFKTLDILLVFVYNTVDSKVLCCPAIARAIKVLNRYPESSFEGVGSLSSFYKDFC